jgi:predicted nuclease of predicted toxin-antitoxin system
MLNFLVDEDLPRSLPQRLRLTGFAAEDVREVGLRGHTDDEVLRYAVAHGLTLSRSRL